MVAPVEAAPRVEATMAETVEAAPRVDAVVAEEKARVGLVA